MGEPGVTRRIADRYRVVRTIGAGGMGVVHEGWDERLSRPVAIKLLPPHVVGLGGARERLLREARSAAGLEHPGVVRVYDAGLTEDGGAFVILELIHGENLATLIRAGRLSPRAQLDVVIQLARALSAVHRAGLVHRDVKPGNVMIRPDGRAVLLDFGVAKRVELDPSAPPGEQEPALVTVEGAIVGTLAYLSPEQARGAPADARSDQFSLGVLAYETFTGRLPWRLTGGVVVLFAVVHEAPEPPSALGAPPWVDEPILRSLSKAAEARYHDVAELAEALAAGGDLASARTLPLASGAFTPAPTVATAGTPASTHHADLASAPTQLHDPSTQRRGWRARWGAAARRARGAWFAAAASLAVALAGLSLVSWKLREGTRARRAATVAQARVVVLGLRDLSGREETAWISTAASEVVVAALAEAVAHVVPLDAVARMRSELELDAAAPLDPVRLKRLRDSSGADLVLSGTYRAAPGPTGWLDVELVAHDPAGSEAIAEGRASGTVSEIQQIVERAMNGLCGELDLTGGCAPRAVPLPRSHDAVLAYADGLALLRRFDVQGALARLERARNVEPSHPLPHAALAHALIVAGRESDAVAPARAALDLAASLPREQRLALEVRYHLASTRWEEAITCARELYAQNPGDLEHGLTLVHALAEARRKDEALALIAELRRLPAPLGQDPRLDFSEALTYHLDSEIAALLPSARRAVDSALARGAPLLAAYARLEMSWALLNLGRIDEAVESAQRARETFQRFGDPVGANRVLGILGIHWNNRGELARAVEVEREAFALAEKLGSRDDTLSWNLNLTQTRLRLGLMDQAAEGIELSIRRFREARPEWLAGPLVLKGWHLELAGRPDEGARVLAQAAAEAAAQGDAVMRGWALWRAGELELARTSVPEARRLLEESHRLRSEAKLEIYAAESRASLARAALAGGDARRAEELARSAGEVLRQLDSRYRVAIAEGIEAAALARQGETERAAAAARRARATLATIDDVLAGLDVRLLLAQVDIAAGAGPARRSLEELELVREDAAKRGLVPFELRARLWIGKAERASGRVAAARTLLGDVEREARAAGFALLADEARAAAR